MTIADFTNKQTRIERKEKGEKMKSIMQNDKRCFITGRDYNLHKHHIFGQPTGKYQKVRPVGVANAEIHNGNNPDAVHNNLNKGYDLMLKQMAQRRFTELHGHENSCGR